MLFSPNKKKRILKQTKRLESLLEVLAVFLTYLLGITRIVQFLFRVFNGWSRSYQEYYLNTLDISINVRYKPLQGYEETFLIYLLVFIQPRVNQISGSLKSTRQVRVLSVRL